jgi:membrane protease YdiL (CAAX protease family)
MEQNTVISSQDPSRKIQAIELAVFLLLIFPSMLISTAVAKPESLTFPLVAGSTILSDIPLLCLVLFFVWRNRESFPSIGLTLRNGWREAAVGGVLFVPLLLGMSLIEKILRAGGLSVPQEAPSFLVPSGAAQVALALLLLVVVAVCEEVIFRGYLIRRFTALSRNPVWALVLSSGIFAMGHGYERSGGVVGVGILGLIFGAIYLWRKSLVAPMVMHFIQNFVGMILIPFGVLL